jgi:fatty-acyl-CoA synthase
LRIDPLAIYGRATPGALACADLETGRRWAYCELDVATNRVANWLIRRLGPASGARVATLGKNCADILILQLAAIRAGAVFTPLNWRLSAAEIATLVADATPSLIFVEPGIAQPSGIDAVFDLSELERICAGEPGETPPAAARRGFEAVSTLLYTSGTSGRPKGVMLSERNAFWGCTNFIHGNDVSASSTFLCDMPLFHTAGLFAAARTPLLAGGTALISRGFDPEKTLARLTDAALGVTHYFSVPQMAQTLWLRPEFCAEKLQRLKVWAIGGAPNPAAQTERFVRAGIRIAEGFGMSETGSNFGMPTGDLELLLRKKGSCGLPFLAIEARIVGDDGAEVAAGGAGELHLRGPSIASGYWNQPRLSAEAFVDGWFKTGDVARRDEEGFYYLVDRKKDMYISGGENVYPAEVEAVISEIDEVAEVAVIGVPDERWGEVGCAYVVVAKGRSLAPEAIVRHCETRLAKYKTPKSVVITDAIPRTASGKVQKHLLKAKF